MTTTTRRVLKTDPDEALRKRAAEYLMQRLESVSLMTLLDPDGVSAEPTTWGNGASTDTAVKEMKRNGILGDFDC